MHNPIPWFRSRNKLRICFSPMSMLFLASLISLASPLTITSETTHLQVQKHLQIAHSTCQDTLYSELCVSTLRSLPDLNTMSVTEFISATLNRTLRETRASSSSITSIRSKGSESLGQLEKVALKDCLDLLDSTIAELMSALLDLSHKKSVLKHYKHLQTLLSAAMTNQYTCLDGFAYSKGNVRDIIENSFLNISRHISNSLVMLKKVPGVNTSKYEASPADHNTKQEFPTWLSSKDRKLLKDPANATQYNLIVAKDGTGNFTSISEAVAAAPNSSATRFVIYIKSGSYFENVEVETKKTMIMFVGDGIGKTIVKASRNVVEGWTTFRTATVAVVGNGFIAKGITFENGAGPSKHQAVALRSGSDLSAFYKCSFVGYQDTLYVHSFRQFYRECDIYGTIDFIFGNAAAVFQNCSLYARKPNQNQRNIFTAQGRDDPNQNTGISILNSKVAAASDLIPVQSSFRTYLGRPWKEYSRTVFIQCDIGDLINPVGWLEWNGSFALSTLYYGEYKNTGPGSNTSARVTWPGFRVINSLAEASLFSVGTFIQGREWLNSTGIPYSPDLS